MPPSTERKASGLDLVARDKPSDNLMLKSGASWLQPSLPGAWAQAEKGAGTPMGPGAGGLTSKPVSYGQHPRRGNMPHRASPSESLSGWIRTTGGPGL